MSLEFPHENKNWLPPVSPESISGAIFSDDHRFRYKLWRRWGKGPMLLFIGLNPSTANELRDDPTVLSCVRIAKYNGFGGMFMGNLFGLVSSDPKALVETADPLGSGNDQALIEMGAIARNTVACWGYFGKFQLPRSEAVRKMFRALLVLGLNKTGQPRHPLYVPKHTCLKAWADF